VNRKMNLEDKIERVWNCSWRPGSFELGGHDRESLSIHLEVEIKCPQRCHAMQ
jgi:hypothetical protein